MAKLILKNTTLMEVRNKIEKLRIDGLRWGGRGFLKPTIKEVELRTLHQTESLCRTEAVFKVTKRNNSLAQWFGNAILNMEITSNGQDIQISYQVKRPGALGCLGLLALLNPFSWINIFFGIKSDIDPKFYKFIKQEVGEGNITLV